MEREELRIGNYLKLGERYGKVLLINYEHIDLYDENYDDGKGTFDYPVYDNPNLSPIQLTAEWLEGFGLKEVYKYTDNNQGLIRRGLCEYSDKPKISAQEFFFDSKPSQLVYLNVLKHEIKYVHQLQNLYYALTGKELVLGVTINEVQK